MVNSRFSWNVRNGLCIMSNTDKLKVPRSLSSNMPLFHTSPTNCMSSCITYLYNSSGTFEIKKEDVLHSRRRLNHVK